MEGAGVLYNTYWVRFARGQTTFDLAVENSTALFEAAAKAGVGRIVHFSVTNAASDSRLPYFRGKGQVEESLKRVGVPYAIIRPTLVFGEGDILVNNIAWALRRFPVFPVYGDGAYPDSARATSKTLRLRQWRPAPSVGNFGRRTPPGRTRCPLKRCCAC